MLVTRCAFCGYTAPYACSGKFMPHPPMFASLTDTGPTCPACGPMPLAFSCPYFHSQYLYIPGVSPVPQEGYSYAAVAQVQPGASSQSIREALREVLGEAGHAVGEGSVEEMFGQF